MLFPNLLLAFLFSSACHSQDTRQEPLQRLASNHEQLEHEGPCRTSFTTAFESIHDNVPFPASPVEQPKLPTINKTAWEQWFFESVSESGLSGFVMSFSRDPSYGFFGRGNLRVEFYLVMEDGTTIQDLDFAENSTVVQCAAVTRGEWTTRDSFYSFELSNLTGEAKLTFRTASGQGILTLSPTVAPYLPNGKPVGSTKGSTLLVPMFHMVGTSPASRVHVNMTISGTQVTYSGTGSHMQMWAADGLLKVTEAFHLVRGTAGPFSFFYWGPVSRVWKGVQFATALLFHNGDQVITTQVGQGGIGDSSASNQVQFSNTFNGLGRRGGLAHDPSTGHILEFATSDTGMKWRFEIEHVNKHFEMSLGGPYGATGFTNRVFGGEVGGCQYRGSAWSEQAVFPETIAKWRAWIAFGIGMLQRGGGAVMRYVSWLF